MMDTYDLIASMRTKYGDVIYPAITQHEVFKFQSKVQNRYSYVVPDEYLKFLGRYNSLEFNGHILYGVDEILLKHGAKQYEGDTYLGFLYNNDILRIDRGVKDLIVFGEDDMSSYVVSVADGRFYRVDSADLNIALATEFYATFDDMVSGLFRNDL